VKLDLGAENDEEDEEEEEEEEDDVIEEDNESDDAPIEFNLEDIEQIISNNIQIPELQVKEAENENFAPIPEVSERAKISQVKKGKTKKVKKKIGTNQKVDNLKSKIDNSEKTVFTRISEDLFNKFTSGKVSHNKKSSAYDYLINDMFLNRVVEKNDKDATSKFNNFVVRNKEFRYKKSIKLQEKTEKVENEINTYCTGKPNGKIFDKSELRQPDVYLQDQLKYYETRDQMINQLREDIKSKTDSKIKKVPEISKNSKELAEKKLLAENNGKEVYDRLFEDKLQKEKKNVYSENPLEKSKKFGVSLINQPEMKIKRKSKEEIQSLIEKLHNDAEDRKVKKEETQKDKLKLKEVYKMYDSDDELTSNSSKLKILEKFVQGYELILNKLFNKKDSLCINFDEFCIVMLNLGFIRFEHTTLDQNNNNSVENFHTEINEKSVNTNLKSFNDTNLNTPCMGMDKKMIDEVKKTIIVNKKKKIENKLIKDAWKILSDSTIEEENDHNDEKIDTNQLLVFCASLLGLYKGETTEEEKVERRSDQIITTNNNGNEDFSNQNTNIINSEATNNRKTIEKNLFKLTTKISSPKENHKITSFHNVSFRSTNMKSAKMEIKNESKNLLKLAVPELDMNKYNYLKKTVKQIKMLFRYMYDNRVEFIVETKRKERGEKLSNQINDSNSKPNISNPEKLKQNADNFRRKLYQEIENDESQKQQESNSQSPTNFQPKHIRKLRLDQVYNLMKKKKEKYLFIIYL
jgi:hypothetical protein